MKQTSNSSKMLQESMNSCSTKETKLYKERQLNEQELTENDYKDLILEHYTFLKRPILVIDDHVVLGNATKIIKETRKHL